MPIGACKGEKAQRSPNCWNFLPLYHKWVRGEAYVDRPTFDGGARRFSIYPFHKRWHAARGDAADSAAAGFSPMSHPPLKMREDNQFPTIRSASIRVLS